MAPPAIQSVDAFSDTQVRDFYHRQQYQMAPSGNILQKFYNTLAGTTGNLSAAEVVSMNVSTYQGQYDLLLSTTANRLDGNTLTTANAATWTANSMITVTPSQTTIRSANVQVGNLNVTGASTLDKFLYQCLHRSLAVASGSAREICQIQGTQLASFVELTIVFGGSTDLVKHYAFAPSETSETGNGVWHRLVPRTASRVGDIAVEVSVAGSGTFLRLVRTALGLQGSSVECLLKVHTDRNTGTIIVPMNAASTVTPSTVLYENTVITQVDGRVGIKTDDPKSFQALDVRGNTTVTGLLSAGNTNIIDASGAYRINGTNVLTATALGGAVTTSSLTSVGTLNSLSVNGLIQAGQLNVTGDINLDANTFKLDSTNNRVGIVKTAPSYTLDVGGDANLSTGNVYRINGVQVLSGSALGTGVTSSSLTTVGPLANLTMATNGLAKLDSFLVQSFVRSLGTTVNSSTEICRISGTWGIFGVELTVVQAGITNQARTYSFVCSSNTVTQTEWRRLIPLTSAPDSSNNFIVEIRYASSDVDTVTLRLVRTAAGGSTSDIGCVLRVSMNRTESVTITPITATAIVTTPATIPWFNTLLTQVNGNVGIGTDNPQYALDVVGVTNFGGNVISGNVNVLGTANVSTLKATTLTVSGTSTFSNTIMQSFERSLPGTNKSFIEICDITGGSFAGFQVELAVVLWTTGIQHSRLYSFCISGGTETGSWRRLVPLCSSQPTGFIVEIMHVNDIPDTTSLRLVRSQTGTTASAVCSLRVQQGTNSVTITPKTGTGTVTDPATTVFENTLITQSNGYVGIGTDYPLYALDVVGAGNFSGNVISGNISVAGMANVSILKATTVDVANLSTPGNVKAGGESTFTLADASTFNFSDKMRLRYNSTADQLEIQRNTAGTWDTTAILAA